MTKIKNLTPHKVILKGEDGKVNIFRSMGVIRASEMLVDESFITTDEGDRIKVVRKEFRQPNLPEEQDGIIYIVSLPVCITSPHRKDIYIPNDIQRDERGRIQHCKSISMNPFYRGDEDD